MGTRPATIIGGRITGRRDATYGRGIRTALLCGFLSGAVALVLASGVALAAPVDCVIGTTCQGTQEADTISGTAEADHIIALGGNDQITARKGDDMINPGSGDDATNGGSGNDEYKFEDGWGSDTVTADASATRTPSTSAPSPRP